MDLNKLAKEVHKANQKWWHDLETGDRLDRNKGELLMLVVSEISECLEGERKNLQDDKLPHRKMAEVEMADTFIRCLDLAAGFDLPLSEREAWETPDNKGEALLDIVISATHTKMMFEILPDDKEVIGEAISLVIANVIAYCNKFGYDLMGAYKEKMEYNAIRKDHQIEARKQPNGKKF